MVINDEVHNPFNKNLAAPREDYHSEIDKLEEVRNRLEGDRLEEERERRKGMGLGMGI
jgi:hypothetical protein